MNRRLKILVSAYACEPGRGSEPGVGWNWVRHLATKADVCVITRANNKMAIESDSSSEQSFLSFVYVDLPKWMSFWKKKRRGLYLYYCCWQVLAFIVAYRLWKKVKFDVVHHLTFGNLWQPTFMSFIPATFVWGPIGGGDWVPWNFLRRGSICSMLLELLRRIIIGSLPFNPFFLYNCMKAHLIIAKTEETVSRIPSPYRQKVVLMTDVGISEENSVNNSSVYQGSHIQVLCVGTLVYWRGFDIAIRAFSKAVRHYQDMELVLIGDGPERRRLERLASENGFRKKVLFVGSISKEEVDSYIAKSSIYLHTCIKEGSVTILMDAMQAGLPVICLDTRGVTKTVSIKCGVKVARSDPVQVVSEIADALVCLAKNRNMRERMGQESKAAVSKLTWQSKTNTILKRCESLFDHSECIS